MALTFGLKVKRVSFTLLNFNQMQFEYYSLNILKKYFALVPNEMKTG